MEIRFSEEEMKELIKVSMVIEKMNLPVINPTYNLIHDTYEVLYSIMEKVNRHTLQDLMEELPEEDTHREETELIKVMDDSADDIRYRIREGN